jgi:hypothetical protein
VRYFLAQHVRDRVQASLLVPWDGWLAKVLERFPLLLKQLNSAVVLLSAGRTA